MDLSILCRACMHEILQNDTDDYNGDLVKMFSFCTKIEISEDLHLPQQFCCDCLKTIESSYNFIKKALIVDATLKDLFKDKIIKNELDSQDRNSEEEHDPLSLSLKKELTENHSQKPDKESSNICKETYEINDCSTELNKIYLERANICKICNKDFKMKGWLDRHVEKEHSQKFVPGRFNCDYCSKNYTKKTFLDKHLRCHTGNAKIYSCKTCNKGFTNRAIWRSHTVQHLNKVYICNECGNKYKSKSSLKSHIESVHEKAKKSFLCAHCGAVFGKAASLAEHLRIHTGSKPYPCDRCESRFRTSGALKRHLLRHTGLRDKECQQCSKKFISKSDLARHVRTHTGSRPYACPLCASAFVDSWHRKAHMTRTHAIALQDIPRMNPAGEQLTNP